MHPERFTQPDSKITHPETPSEEGVSVEKEPGFDLKFYVTDHSADHADTGNPKRLRELYADIKRDGVESVRYDWRWSEVEFQAGEPLGAQHSAAEFDCCGRLSRPNACEIEHLIPELIAACDRPTMQGGVVGRESVLGSHASREGVYLRCASALVSRLPK